MQETVGGRIGIDVGCIGDDASQPASFEYKPLFQFSGTIEKVTVEIK